MKHILVVLTNAEEGRDEEFNDWYDEQHLDDVLDKIDGFVAAQRFRLSDTALGQDAPYRYLAIYEVEGDRVDEAHAALLASRSERIEAEREGRTPQVPISPALQQRREAWLYSAITERRSSA